MKLPQLPNVPKPKTPEHVVWIGLVCVVIGWAIVFVDVPWLAGMLLLMAGVAIASLGQWGASR